MNYTIAVIAAGISEEYQQSILRGIHRYAAQHHVNIAHFIANDGILANPNNDIGEHNIFELPNFSLFDGVILLSNTFSAEIFENLSERIRAAGIPAVSIDRESEFMQYIGIQNAPAMEQITRHLIEKHNVRCFNYISGPDDNTESIERLNAFLRVLKEYNIPMDEQRIYHGAFRPVDGKLAVEAFLKSGMELPQAIVCGNDAMALSALLTLETHGISCPNDILVSGFDNIYNAKNFSPSLTTVERPLMQSGALACQMICECCAGEHPARTTELSAVPIFAESCGCECGTTEDVSLYKKRSYQTISFTNQEIFALNQMACSLVNCDSLEEYFDALRECVLATQCEEFYFCLNDNWFTNPLSHENGYTGEMPPEEYIIRGYSKRMLMPLAYYDGKFQPADSFASEAVLPRLLYTDTDERTRNMYFVPLHFRERCLGYFAIVNSELPLSSPLFHTWGISIGNTLENLRKILCLDEIVHALDKLYAIDSVTGILNRNGFRRCASDEYNRCIEEQRPVMIMFVDMDGLKNINDQFGHKAGDRAIRSIAAILQECCLHDEVACRFGGDEFFIFSSDGSEEKALSMRWRIQSCLDICNRFGGQPYELSVSIGACITVPQADTSIFELITIADNQMFEEKKKKNPSKYLKAVTVCAVD